MKAWSPRVDAFRSLFLEHFNEEMGFATSAFDLRGVRVLVTGGTSGLGRAMAHALVQAGAHVAVTSRDGPRAQATAVELGPNAYGVALDVRDVGSVTAAVDAVYEVFGGLDVLVNNAGIGMRTVNPRFMTAPQPFWEVSDAGFRDVLATKAIGTFLVSRAVVPRMLDAGHGRVVTVSMNDATMTRRGFVPYGPSGAAVEAFARVMAADLEGTRVTANILLPGGATATGMVPDDIDEATRNQLLDPSVMGPAIVWLASPDADGVHNERIVARDFADWLIARARRAEVK
ncbi:MAG: SDR family NAD(P)-dependent oxidoreductase [Acidimicrobiales bacterium]